MAKNTENFSQEKGLIQEPEKTTLIGLHSVKNLLGNEQQLTLFNDHSVESFSKTYGIKLHGKIERFGIDLTDIQARVVEAILRGFTTTNYKGNTEPKNKLDVVREKYAFGELPSTYKYINQIPCLKATQAQIIEWAGMNKRSIAERERLVEALKHLGTAQYCFYYDRLALDKNGMPEKDTDGKWKKEEVIAIDTLFMVKEIRDKRTGAIQYYEIVPSPIFLDQRESYFMLIPYNWREEVRALVGSKKASSYTFRFILFLRYQYELKRRSQKGELHPFIIKWKWEDIAIAIKMPESVYKRKKDRALKILNDAYSVAQQLGYLKDYSRNGDIDCLILNEHKYSCAKGNYYGIEEIEEIKASLFSESAVKLFDLFHEEKLKRDPKHKIPTAKVRTSHLSEFEKLLKSRSKAEISQIINWGLGMKYWCSRIGTPAKLRQNFSEAWIEMKNSVVSPNSEEDRIKDNKAIVESFIQGPRYRSQKQVKVELMNAYVEIGNGLHQPICISYKEKGFKEQFESALRKWKLL